MSVIAVVAQKCVCKMAPWEAWAVRTSGFLVGYYLACQCGRVNVLLADELGIKDALPFSTSKPFLCSRCEARWTVIHGRIEAA
jgi:hypothetical protein